MAIKSRNKYIQQLMACLGIICALASCESGYEKADMYVKETPVIFPDYTNIILPKNIAPLNFRIQQEADAYQVVFRVGDKEYIKENSSDANVVIPEKKWHEMLAENGGKELCITIGTQKDDKWTEYKTIRDTISNDTIDRYLVYRLIYPGYELWNEMGIYQRDLTTFAVNPIMENKNFGKQCVNCHTFNHNSPQDMMVHVRGEKGGTLIWQKGVLRKVSPKRKGIKMGATYAGWHPSGRYIAYSMNEVQQFFHSAGKKPVEVSDLAADLGVYDIEKDEIITSPELSGDSAMETFPAWSPDGKTLYYCRGNAYTPSTPLDSIRYDLYRIPFNPETRQFGKPECVYPASKSHHTVSLPRVSPDGRFIVFAQFDYGTFSIWHPESDLMLLDTETGALRSLKEINSRDVESFHTWSSTGNWLVFSSKRLDGSWARPFFAHFNHQTGRFSKPFLLPQEDPGFYDTFMMTFNLPEMITTPIHYGMELQKKVR